MLLKTFVLEKKYLTEEELVDYYSFCQLLPGASSTQIIGLIGYKRGGIVLSILTLLIWIIPACIFMGAFSFFITSSKYEYLTASVFRFIQPMAIGFLAFATYKMYFLSIKNTITQIIMLSSTVLTFLFFKSPWIFPLLIILGGIATNFSDKRIPKDIYTKPNKISWNNAWLFILIFLFAGILSESARSKEWPNRKAYNLFENFYRFGSIVFGGGDVLIPMMLDQYVARPQSKNPQEQHKNAITIEQPQLLTGYGIVRIIPGPVFSIGSYVGGVALQDQGKKMHLLGCIIGSVAIFLPSILLLFFLFPIWENLKRYVTVFRALEGINAVIVGLIFAASLFLLKGILLPGLNLITFYNLFIIFGTFLLLRFTKLPSPVIVLLCLLLGWIF